MIQQGGEFSEDPEENLRIENEILKIKLKAQYGDAFHMEAGDELPAELENQFLKSVIAFEDEHAVAEYTTIYERIGKPACKNAAEMGSSELHKALTTLFELLEKNEIYLQILDGPYHDERLYNFITGELFSIKVENKPVPGLKWNFVYEEFYPNHNADIGKRAHTFLTNWFNGRFTEYCTELSWHCITYNGVNLTREQVIEKMDVFFDAFRQFSNNAYNIDSISFELQANEPRGMGFAEGTMKFDAEMDKGETIHYEGPFKLYMQMEDNWWSIFYFVVPGFKW